MKNPTYQAKVMLSTEFLKQLLHQVDDDTSLVMIGDLSQYRGFGLEGVVRESIETADEVFSASHGQLTIPLSGDNKYRLKKEMLPAIGIRTLIQDVMLERYGRLLFESTNYFKDEVKLDHWFKPEFIDSLQNDGIIHISETHPRTVTTQPRVTASGFRFVMG